MKGSVSLDSIRVLHVDDDPDFTSMVATFLEREDDRLAVETATTADEALDRLTAEVDCVVSDYDMPGRNGIDLLETVREGAPELPFILYTGMGSETVASEAFSAGATEYLQKEGGTDQYTLLANKVTNAVEKYATEAKMRRRARAMETAGEGIAIIDGDGRYTEVNEAYADLYGTTANNLVGEAWTTTVPDAEVDRLRADAFPAIESEASWTGESRGKRVDGSTYPKLLSLASLDDGGHVCVIRNISERKAREQELNRARRKFKKLFTHTNDAIFIADPVHDEFLDCNPAAAELMGLSRSALLDRKRPSEAHPEDVMADLRSFFDRVLDQGHSWTDEVPILTDDGEVRDVEMSAAYLELDGRPCLVTNVRDVTDRAERERELRRYEHMVNAMREAVCIYDAEGRFEVVTEYLAEFYGTTRETLEGEYSPLVQRIRDEAAGDPFRALLDGERAELRGEIDAEFPEYGRTVLDYRLSPLTTEGSTDHVVGVARIVTDRKEREWELRRYERIVEASGDPVYMLDPDGRFAFVNDRLVEKTGYAKRDLLGEHVSVVMAHDDVKRGQRLIQSLLASGEDQRTFEMDVITADGGTFTCENHVALLVDDEFRGTVGIVRDISERKERESELERQNERLEKFASFVSHDLRNPLNVAQGRLELLRAECDSDDLDRAIYALDRSQRLIDDLLTVASTDDHALRTESVPVDEVVECCWRTVDTAEATLDSTVETTVRANRSRLQQLLANLVRNAVEHGGADVTITVGDCDDGFYVADNGAGLSAAERDRLFDPGYSTSDEGTGFGLSIVRDIAGTYGWTVDVTESESGGARVEIRGVDTGDE